MIFKVNKCNLMQLKTQKNTALFTLSDNRRGSAKKDLGLNNTRKS